MNGRVDSGHEIGRARCGAIALVSAILFGATATVATAKVTVKPSNSSLPTISGTTQEGSTLTANPGNWNGSTPITFQYQWRRCDSSGNNCANISGQTASTYVLVSADDGNTVRVRVTASNANGSSSIGSDPSAKISGPTVTTTTTTTPATGCPSGTGTVDVTGITPPARLQVDKFSATPAVIPGTMTSFTLTVAVTDTCGQAVQGALVYATAVPFGQVKTPAEAVTGADGTVTLTFVREKGFPATGHQTLMVLFIRARKSGDDVLAGITTGRLVSIPVRLH